jgi:hypothetical protein
MKIKKKQWDKDKHGLVWEISDVFRPHELEYIQSQIPKKEIVMPKGIQTSYNVNRLPLIEESYKPILKHLYPKLLEECIRESTIFSPISRSSSAWTPTDYANIECEARLQGTAQGLNYKIHPDMCEKILTFLVYIHPEVQEPTYFHAYKRGIENKKKEEDPDPLKYIPWKVNTGYIFLPNEKSMHSYANTIHGTDRYVVLGNLLFNGK